MGALLRSAVLFFALLAPGAGAASNDMAHQMLAETNLARTAPQRYAQHLRDLRRHYRGNGFWLPGTSGLVLTSEGVQALDEALHFLERQTPLAPLAWSPGLARAAGELVKDEGKTGEVGHTGSRSGDVRQRIERQGSWQSRIAENIGYGPQTARLMVMQLIIDDGVPDRGHRKNMFDPAFKAAGAACGPHPEYRNMCVMDFAAGFSGSK